jgi:hypothetical protein
MWFGKSKPVTEKVNDLALRLTNSAEEWALSQWRRDDPFIYTAPLMALGIAAGVQTALVVQRKHLDLMSAVNFSVGCLLRQLSDEKAPGDDDSATEEDLERLKENLSRLAAAGGPLKLSVRACADTLAFYLAVLGRRNGKSVEEVAQIGQELVDQMVRQYFTAFDQAASA